MTIKELKTIINKLPESANIYVSESRRLANIESIQMVVNMDTNVVDYYIEIDEDTLYKRMIELNKNKNNLNYARR